MKTLLIKWIFILSALFTGSGSLSGTESKTILMLVTGADKMTNGKPTGLWLEEFVLPYQALVQAGYQIEVVSPKGGAVPIDPRSQPGTAQAAAWKEATARLSESKALSEINPERFSAIFIPGGHGVMFDLAGDVDVARLIGEFDAQGKPVAAVCHGPAALVKVVRKDGSPLVKGRKVTGFTNAEERAVGLDQEMPFLLETKLRDLGATVETRDNFTVFAVRDGNLITGQNPASSEKTAQLLIEALSGEKK